MIDSPALTLPVDAARATLVGRIGVPGVGPTLVTRRGDALIDLSRLAPTASELFERDDPAAAVAAFDGPAVARLADVRGFDGDATVPHWLAPCDLQPVKAAGVTFVASLLERVIEERARGDAAQAQEVRAAVTALIGDDLSRLKPGSAQAAQVKAVLIERGMWSQYLEVGIGPDAEIFTKAPPLSAVGHGAAVGLHPGSTWNNPEPEIVLAVNSRGAVVGATLGNDVNLRDFEGRSALLLGKAKDNNGSCAIGPFVRLFDAHYTLDDVRAAELGLQVRGEDGFALEGSSSMRRISRDPLELVAQAIGAHHQYPDGLMLFCGTMFAPVQDRDAPGAGFTHHRGDRVTIGEPRLGALSNVVDLSDRIPRWTFGAAVLMRNLAARGLLPGPGDQASAKPA